jgi:hypothetical protein
MRSLTGDILEFDLRSQSFMGPAMKCSDMSTIDPDELRRSIAVIFQDFIRYHLPARDNIGLGRLDAIDDLDAIRDAARHASADAFLETLPSGYQTMLGPEFIGGTDLSIGQWQVIDVYLSPRRDAMAAQRLFEQAIGRTRISPMEVTTDRYRVYPRVLDELLPAAFHDTEVHANNPIETDHGRLKARLRPMRGLKRDRTARVIVAGHAFVQNLRRGFYDLGTDVPPTARLADAFSELALVI